MNVQCGNTNGYLFWIFLNCRFFIRFSFAVFVICKGNSCVILFSFSYTVNKPFELLQPFARFLVSASFFLQSFSFVPRQDRFVPTAATSNAAKQGSPPTRKPHDHTSLALAAVSFRSLSNAFSTFFSFLSRSCFFQEHFKDDGRRVDFLKNTGVYVWLITIVTQNLPSKFCVHFFPGLLHTRPDLGFPLGMIRSPPPEEKEQVLVINSSSTWVERLVETSSFY